MTALPPIVLPWARTSDLSGNSRLHWRKKADLIRAQRRTADALAREAGWHKITVPEGATLSMTLTYCPPARGGIPDDDNVIAANKGARDALAAMLGVDDGRISCRAVQGDRCKDGAVIVDMRLAGDWQHVSDVAARIEKEMARQRANAPGPNPTERKMG